MLTAFFDLTRIAALGIIFYLIMDIAIHWGVMRYLRKELGANPVIPITAIVLNMAMLGGFLWIRITSDPFVLIVAAVIMAVLIGEFFFLRQQPADDQSEHPHSH